ncbi:small terminase subunit [Lentilactobacillus kribbianus]|uniref:small terminase subunit n=1 Tax=Lentilactobacillus kribbianus TaxID=2729622 RepID=UPI0015578566|nr:small terminase subunit [Lentilactobacillus kribbianus]
MAPRTFERWKKEHSQIRQAIKGGKEVANFVIENELYKKAKSGNVTAMIFFLKNNYREKYTDDQTDPALRQAQIRKASAEAAIAEGKAKAINRANSVEDSTLIVDDVPSEGDGDLNE